MLHQIHKLFIGHSFPNTIDNPVSLAGDQPMLTHIPFNFGLHNWVTMGHNLVNTNKDPGHWTAQVKPGAH